MDEHQISWKVLNAAILPRVREVLRILESKTRGTNVTTGHKELTPLSDDILTRLKNEIPTSENAPPTPLVVAVALDDCGGDFDRLAKALRDKAENYYRMNFLIAVAMVLLFVGGAGGAIILVLFKQVNIWGLVFGGALSLSGAFGLFVTRPVRMTLAALMTTTRFDVLALMYKSRLQGCKNHPSPQERVVCYETVFQQFLADLNGLTPHP